MKSFAIYGQFLVTARIEARNRGSVTDESYDVEGKHVCSSMCGISTAVVDTEGLRHGKYMYRIVVFSNVLWSEAHHFFFFVKLISYYLQASYSEDQLAGKWSLFERRSTYMM
jgi:hypothetical protein